MLLLVISHIFIIRPTTIWGVVNLFECVLRYITESQWNLFDSFDRYLHNKWKLDSYQNMKNIFLIIFS